MRKMRKWQLLFIGFLWGLLGFFLFPLGFKFFGFIVPAFILSHALSKEEDRFNKTVFVLSLCIFLLIPSNLITFDAENSMNFDMVISGTYAMVSVFCVILFFGVPIFMALGVIWSFIIGKTGASLKGLLRLIATVAILTITIGILGMMNLNIPFLNGVVDTYVELINFCFKIPYVLYDIINALLNGYNAIAKFLDDWIDLEIPRVPTLPSISKYEFEGVSFDSAQTHFSSMSYTETVFAVHDSLPIMMSIICLITSLFMIKKDWEKAIIQFITDLSLEEKKKKPIEEKIYLPHVNYKLLFYMFFLLFFSFLIFLSYSKSYGKDPREDIRYIGYFGMYTIMTIVSILVINLQGYTYYKDSNLTNTVKGTVIGLVILYLITRLFTTQQTMSAFSAGDISADVAYIVNTFVFIAPAESLFFHVLYPALVGGKLKSYTEKKTKKTVEVSIRDEIVDLELEIKHTKRRIEIEKLKGSKKDVAVSIAVLNNLQQKQKKLEETIIEKPEFDEKSIFGRKNTCVMFIIFGAFGGGFLFAIAHWIVPFVMSDYTYDFFSFWAGGLGVIYLSSGVFFIYISMKYGWAACVATHSIYNTLTIIMIIICLGG